MGSREHETNLVLANLNKPFEIFIRVALVGQQFSRSNIIDHGVYVGMTPSESISRMHFFRTPAVIKTLAQATLLD